MSALRYLLNNGAPGAPDLSLTTLDAFLEANAFEPEIEAALRALEPGETFQGDEGAGGTWSLRRLDGPVYGIRVRGELRPELFPSATEATLWALSFVPSWIAWEWVPLA